MVIGEQQRFLIALLTLEPEASTRFAEDHGLDVTTLHENEMVRKHIDEAIERDVNSQFARVEHIRNYAILPADFTTEGGELTPTLKIKRGPVNEKYAADITACYAAGQVL